MSETDSTRLRSVAARDSPRGQDLDRRRHIDPARRLLEAVSEDGEPRLGDPRR